MKLTRCKKWTVLALALANGFLAAAQSNGVPGPADYPAFSGFISERNIFDPNRYPRNSARPIRPRTIYPRTRSSPSTPAFSLVGTMSYEKGMFAFFDGNNSDLRKVLYQPDTNGIAGFTVTEITPAGVTLQSADKKRTVQMKIGEVMRQEDGEWQMAGQGQLDSGAGTTESTAPAVDNSATGASATPSPALEGNDILKKLMQQREQELK
jgi:hypothetical protein